MQAFARSGSAARIALLIAAMAVHTAYAAADSPPPATPAGGDTTPRVSLRVLLAYADRHAPGLLVPRAEAEQAESAARVARAWLPSDPQVGLTAGARRAAAATGTDWSVSLSQQFEPSGARALRIEAARMTGRRWQAAIADARWQVHHDVHAAYHRSLVARDRAQTAARMLQFSEEMAAIASRRLARGAIPALSASMAQVELVQARQTAAAAANAYRSACMRLGILAGWPQDQLPEPAGAQDIPDAPPPVPTLVELAQHQSPLLQSHRALRDEALALSQARWAERWPRLTMGITYAREAEPRITGQAGDDAHIATIGVGTSLPFWRGNQQDVEEARNGLSVATARLHATQALLTSEIADAAQRVTAAATRLQSTHAEVLPAHTENLEVLRRSFDLGEADMIDIIAIQQRLGELESKVLDTYAEYYEAVAALEWWVGIDLWPLDAHEPNTEPLAQPSPTHTPAAQTQTAQTQTAQTPAAQTPTTQTPL